MAAHYFSRQAACIWADPKLFCCYGKFLVCLLWPSYEICTIPFLQANGKTLAPTNNTRSVDDMDVLDGRHVGAITSIH